MLETQRQDTAPSWKTEKKTRQKGFTSHPERQRRASTYVEYVDAQIQVDIPFQGFLLLQLLVLVRDLRVVAHRDVQAREREKLELGAPSRGAEVVVGNWKVSCDASFESLVCGRVRRYAPFCHDRSGDRAEATRTMRNLSLKEPALER